MTDYEAVAQMMDYCKSIGNYSYYELKEYAKIN